MKKLVAILLVLCLTIPLAACGSKEPEWSMEGSTLSLPDEMAYISAQCIIDEYIYIGGPGNGHAVLARTGLDGEFDFIGLPQDYEYIYALCEAEGNIAVLAGTYPPTYYGTNSEPIENSEPVELELLVLGTDGTLILQTALPENSESYTLMRYSNGDYIFMSSSSLVKLNADGQELARIEARNGEYYFSMISHKGETLVCVAEPNSNRSTICTVDAESLGLSTLTEFSGRFVLGLGTSPDGKILICESSEVSSVDPATGECVLEFSLSDVGVTQSITEISPIGDTLVLYSQHQRGIHTAKRVLAAQSSKVKLTLVTDWIDSDLQQLVNDFNKSSANYRIKIKEFGANYTEDNLRTEIIAGKSPDIFAFYFTETMNNVGDARLYEDLLPYLDTDTEYGRETLVPSLLNVMSSSGQLHWLPYDFEVSTFIALESLFPKPGITFEELERVMAEQNMFEYTFSPWLSKSYLLLWIKSFSLGKFIDKETGTCSFDSPEFASLLEMCNNMTLEEEDVTFENAYAPSLMSLGIFGRIGFGNRVAAEGDYCYVGFPTENGNGSMIRTNLRMAISTQSSYKDGAWEFLRSALSEENQSKTQYMPSTLVALENQMEAKLNEEPKDGTRAYTQEDADKFWDMINNITVLSGGDQVLSDIIIDEGKAYFAGDRTAEEAAAMIQNRASLYMAEQYG